LIKWSGKIKNSFAVIKIVRNFVRKYQEDIMKAVNYSELRQNLKANLDAVTEDELLVVHRSKGRSIVMMSLEEFNALQETFHLNKSKTNRERLESSIENINNKTNLVKNQIIDE